MTTGKLSYVEEVNSEICLKLSKLSYTQFLSFYNDTENSFNNENGNTNLDTDKYTQYTLLRDYCCNMVSNNYKLATEYKYANNKTNGRIFVNGKMGLQRIWNKFRGILCDNINYDLDMKNAHPTILLYLCKLHNIPHYELERYVINREFLISEFMNEEGKTKEEAKIAFITSINNALLITKLNKSNSKVMVNIKNKYFLSYDKEIKTIQQSLKLHYKEDLKIIEKQGTANIEGRLTNILLCKIENEILQKNIEYVSKIYNLIVNVPMFDGFMVDIKSIEDRRLDINTIINKLDYLSLEYGIKWSLKNHNIDILDKLNSLSFEDNILSFLGDNEIEVAKYCLENIVNNQIYICENELWIYNNLIWEKNNKDILIPLISKHDLFINTSKGDKPINKCNKDLQNLINLIAKLAPQKADFNSLMYYSTIYKLCYKNGFYSFKDKKFIKYTNDNIPFTKFIIDRNYEDIDNVEQSKQIESEIYNRVLFPIFNVSKNEKGEIKEEDYTYKNMKYILHKLSRMIAGHIEDKELLVFLGERNSGKGMIQGFFLNTFGKNYIGSLNTSNLIQKPQSCGEADKEGAWLLGFEFSRIMFGSEIDCKTVNGRHITKLNGASIKSITSGGDLLSCRAMRENSRSFRIQSSLVLTANDMPKSEPPDAMDFCQVFDMPCRFLSKSYSDSLSEDYKKCVIIKEADDTLKDFIRNEAVIKIFEKIILNAYNTPQPKPEKNSSDNFTELDNTNTEHSEFVGKFRITNSEENKITNKELQNLLESQHISFSLLKAQKYLKAMGAIPYKSKYERGLCKIEIIYDDL